MAVAGGVSNVGLGMTFTARDLASGPINLLRGNFSRLHQSVRGGVPVMVGAIGALAGSVTALAAGSAALRGAFNLAEFAGGFEQSMSRIGAVTQASSETLNELEQSAIRAGLATQFSPEQASQGLRDLSTAGFTAAESMNLLTPALALAEGGSIGVSDAATATAAAVRVFGLSMDEAAGTADHLLRITNLTMLQAEDLSLALGTVGRGAGAARQNMDEMLISMGLVRNTGVQASVAASSVSSALLFMAQRTDRFRRLGVSITDANGNFRDFIDIVQDTSRELGTRYASQADRAAAATDLFGRFGITAYQAISGQLASGIRTTSGEMLRGQEALEYLRETMSNAEGTASEFQRRVLDNFPGQMQLLSGTIQTLGTVVGQTFGEIFMPMVEGVRLVLNRFIEVWRAIPEGVRQLLGVSTLAAGAFAVITGAIGTIASLAVLAVSLLGNMIVVIGAVMAGISVAMAPVVALFGALVAVGVMLRRAWQQNLGGLADFVDEWAGRIKMLWDGLEMVMTRGFLGGDLLGDMMDAGEDDMVGFLMTLGDIIADARTIWSAFSESFMHGWELLGPVFRELGVALGEVLDAIFAAFGGGANSLRNAIEGTSGNRLQEIGQIIARYLLTAIRETVKALIVMARVLSMVIRIGTAIAPIIVPALTAVYHAAYAVYTIFSITFGIIGSIVRLFQSISPQLGLFHRFFGERIGRAVGGEEGAEAVRGVRQFSAWNRPQAATGGGGGRAGAAEGGPARVDQTINLRSTVVVDGRELAATQRRVRVEQDSYNGGIFDEGPQSIPEG